MLFNKFNGAFRGGGIGGSFPPHLKNFGMPRENLGMFGLYAERIFFLSIIERFRKAFLVAHKFPESFSRTTDNSEHVYRILKFKLNRNLACTEFVFYAFSFFSADQHKYLKNWVFMVLRANILFQLWTYSLCIHCKTTRNKSSRILQWTP